MASGRESLFWQFLGSVATELTSRASLALPVLPLSSLITMGLIVVVCLILGSEGPPLA